MSVAHLKLQPRQIRLVMAGSQTLARGQYHADDTSTIQLPLPFALASREVLGKAPDMLQPPKPGLRAGCEFQGGLQRVQHADRSRARYAICPHLSMRNVFGKYAGELGPNSIRHHFHLGLQNKPGLQQPLPGTGQRKTSHHSHPGSQCR